MSDAASLERQNKDLTMQCRALLREVEELRNQLASPAVQRALVRSSSQGQNQGASNIDENNLPEVGTGVDAENFITQHLVLYKNVNQLQEQNQKLLKVVRQLSADNERESEKMMQQLREEYGNKIDAAMKEVQDIRQERQELETRVSSLVQQRDMYRILLAEADRSVIGESMGEQHSVAVGISTISEVMSPGSSGVRTTKDAIKMLEQENNEFKERNEAALSLLRTELNAAQDARLKAEQRAAQSESDASFLRDRHKSLQSTMDSLNTEITGLRAKISELSMNVTSYERKISEQQSELLNVRWEKQKESDSKITAETSLKHSEAKINQLNQEIEAIKNEKNQMQRLLNQISMSRDEDQRRSTEDIKRMNEDLERKEKDLTELRSEVELLSHVAKERSKLDEMRVAYEYKLGELRAVTNHRLQNSVLSYLHSKSMRKSDEEMAHLREENIKLESAAKNSQEKADFFQKQLESAESRFREALYQQQSRGPSLGGLIFQLTCVQSQIAAPSSSLESTEAGQGSRYRIAENDIAALKSEIEQLKH
eukprot:756553-Hanusia_phi.AAC.1